MRTAIDPWDEAWQRHWPGPTSEAHQLRNRFPDRWTRFHSLPNSEPYPETSEEHREYFHRHHVLLGELGGTGPGLVTTTAMGTSPHPRRGSAVAKITGPARRWHTFEADGSEPDWPLWVSLFITKSSLDSEAVDPLLTLDAHGQAGGVILAPTDFTWLYHPYEGGADAFLPIQEACDALRRKHADWLSPYPGGL